MTMGISDKELQILLEQSYTTRREQKLLASESGKTGNVKNSRSFNIIQSDIYFAIKDAVIEFVDMKTLSKGRKMPFFRNVVIPYMKQFQEDCDTYGEKNVHKSPANKMITYFLSELITQHSIFEERSKTDTVIKICRKLRFQLGDKDCWEHEIPDEYIIAVLGLVNVAVTSCEMLEESGGTKVGGDAIPVAITLSEEYSHKVGYIREALKQGLTAMEPMICKPAPHKDLISTEGGYLATPSPLLKNPSKIDNKIHPLINKCTLETNPRFFGVINKMQETAYRVDRTMLELIPELFDFIEKDDSDEDSKYDTSNRIVSETVTMARTYAGYSAIYYPLFVDNRGRMYPYASNGLSYQSDDLGKSLVEYSEGRVLTEEGVEALKFALGEYLGVAKVVGPRRMKVVEDALPKLMKQYEGHDWSFVKGDDGLFGFISIVKELYNYYKDPENYVCHKVLHNDACSSGLQLIGLFTKDLLNLKITNVINPEIDQLEDLYLITAAANKERILESNKDRSKNTEHYNTMLDIILDNQHILDDRAVVKTSSMTFYNYGAKQTSVYQNICEKMHSKYRLVLDRMAGEEITDTKALYLAGGGTLKASKYPVVAAFCQNIWDSMQTANPTAVAAQKWMGGLIKYDIKNNSCFSFINPLTGFPVVLRKSGYSTEEINSMNLIPVKNEEGKTEWKYKRIHHRMHRPTNEIKVTKTVSSSIPGIIHAADAAVMVLICEGLGYVTGIHDSAGCHPNDVPQLRRVVASTLFKCSTVGYFQSLAKQCGYNVEPPMVDSIEDLEIIKETLYAFA